MDMENVCSFETLCMYSVSSSLMSNDIGNLHDMAVFGMQDVYKVRLDLGFSKFQSSCNYAAILDMSSGM